MHGFPVRYVVPNAITSVGLLLGVASIFASMQGDTYTANWFILMCVLLDKLDGTAARLLKASSSFGLQLDSFSDFTTFGLAPAFAMHSVVTSGTFAPAYADSSTLRALATAAAMVYALATALRLAKFNVLSERIGSRYFLGLPTTLCGAIVASYMLTAMKYSLPPGAFEVLPALFVVGALLMVSNFRMPKLAAPSSQPWRTVLVLAVISAYVFGFTWLFPEYLLGLALTFAIFGFTYGAVKLGNLPDDDDLAHAAGEADKEPVPRSP